MAESFRAFDKKWFERHQRLLLWLLNNPSTKKLSRYILRIHKDCPDKLIVEILPNCYTVFGRWIDEKTVELTTDFRTHAKFSKRIYYTFRPLWWTLHGWDLFADAFVPQWSFGFSTLTAYPDPNPETTTVDGYVSRLPTSETFSTIQAGAGNDSQHSGAFDIDCRLQASTTSNQYSALRRAIMLFDTSSIGSTQVISSAVLSLWGQNNITDLGTTTLEICSSTPASNTTLVAADYAQLGSTSFGNISSASFTTGAYNDITLNASGITNINKTGISKFGARLGWDLNNNFTGTWAAGNAQTLLRAQAAENSNGTADAPKLVVTYSLPASDLTKMWFQNTNNPIFENTKVSSY